jgi:hypothetical protein
VDCVVAVVCLTFEVGSSVLVFVAAAAAAVAAALLSSLASVFVVLVVSVVFFALAVFAVFGVLVGALVVGLLYGWTWADLGYVVFFG